ncbi:CtsR family transcriptional regulator [Dendrosporobacter sp. 1207_IL3150]|uniref:CtsR family transcriptional regulator n=1 Tax=Dendrosporobacter sp. 1207_IL3150 TaxID=3084054 RepID=UPI002FD9B24A
MSNLADLIEEYILRRISLEQNNIVVLRRNEIAEEIDCAPSQISYVLSTRFTIERGFLVESRRGSGGFIRIARTPIQSIIYHDIANQIDNDTSLEDITEVVRHLVANSLISGREASLIMQISVFMFKKAAPQERVGLLRSVFLNLADFT